MTEEANILVRHYEHCLATHGPTWRGMDWPNPEDLSRRFAVMLGLIREPVEQAVSLLDLGCGAGLLLDHIQALGRPTAIDYRGIDLSPAMVDGARSRHPDRDFAVRDVIAEPLPPRSVDYVVMNGVLTEKLTLSQAAMAGFAQKLITSAFAVCRRGLAFNVMSAHVDWQRDDLFHWPLDDAVAFLARECSRHLVVRMDYGLYEYTVYVYREPRG